LKSTFDEFGNHQSTTLETSASGFNLTAADAWATNSVFEEATGPNTGYEPQKYHRLLLAEITHTGAATNKPTIKQYISTHLIIADVLQDARPAQALVAYPG
jgi:hypothetical protein